MPSNTAAVNLPTTDDTEGLAHRKRIEYLRRYGLRESRKAACACILGGSRKCIDRDFECHAPFWDHPALFKSNATGEFVLVYQPYFPQDNPEEYIARLAKRVEAWAALWHFTVRIDASESFHYPGRTVLVELRKAVR